MQTMQMTVLLVNTPIQAESLLHSLEQTAGGICLHENSNKMESMCFNREGTISSINGSPLKLVDKFMYFGSSISSTESQSIPNKDMDCYL